MRMDRDSWLSEIFGFDVIGLSLEGEDEALDRSWLGWHLGRSAKAFYYAKVPTGRADVVRELSSVGFSVVDVSVTFAMRPAKKQSAGRGTIALSRWVVVRDILPEHYAAVRNIAASCFVYSRFHLDPLIFHELADGIKRSWVDNYIRKKRGERLLVGLMDDKPVGFLAVLSSEHHGEPCRVIDLIGVDKAYQRRGVGKALMSFFIEECAGTGAFARVGTQAANVPSIRLYESLGFCAEETSYVLHAHFPQPRTGEFIAGETLR